MGDAAQCNTSEQRGGRERSPVGRLRLRERTHVRSAKTQAAIRAMIERGYFFFAGAAALPAAGAAPLPAAAGAAPLAAGAAPFAAGAAPFAPAAGAAPAAAGVAVPVATAPSAGVSLTAFTTAALRCATLGSPKGLLASVHFAASLSFSSRSPRVSTLR